MSSAVLFFCLFFLNHKYTSNCAQLQGSTNKVRCKKQESKPRALQWGWHWAGGLQHTGVMNGMGVGPPGDEKCPEMPYLGRVSVLGAEMGLFLLPLPPPPPALILFCVMAEECLTLQPWFILPGSNINCTH